MTNEDRLDQLEPKVSDLDKWHNDADKRFEAFIARIDMYIAKTAQTLVEQRERMNRLEDKHDADNKETRRMLYASISAQVLGVIAILIAIYLK